MPLSCCSDGERYECEICGHTMCLDHDDVATWCDDFVHHNGESCRRCSQIFEQDAKEDLRKP